MPSLIPLNGPLGAPFVGLMISSVLYGITCLQVYLYYTEYSERDNRLLKITVAVLMFLNSVHVALLGVFYYHYTVTDFGDYVALAQITWSLVAQILVGGTIGFLIRGIFAHRVYRLNDGKDLIAPIVISILNMAAFVMSTVFAIKSFEIVLFKQIGTVQSFGTAGLSLDTACDVSVASSLIYCLWNKGAHFPRTKKVISLMITYALNTFVLANICTIVCLAIYVAFPSTLIYTPFYFIYIELYSCSFMSMLNSREAFREYLGGGHNKAITLSGFTSTGESSSHGELGGIEMSPSRKQLIE